MHYFLLIGPIGFFIAAGVLIFLYFKKLHKDNKL